MNDPVTPGKVRVRFETGETFYADLDPDTAQYVLDERDEHGKVIHPADICDISEVAESLKLITHGRNSHIVDAWIETEVGTDDCIPESQVVDGSATKSWYRLARHHVGQALYVLGSGRYREGNCREMDAVAAKLGEIEDLLLKLADEADRTIPAGPVEPVPEPAGA